MDYRKEGMLIAMVAHPPAFGMKMKSFDATAAKAMKTSGCGCAPVVENKENLNLVGVVTERDICHSVAAEDRKASEVSVKEIMSPASACCDADESLEEAAQKLHEHQATSLPVVDKAGSCCGTVSSHHIRK